MTDRQRTARENPQTKYRRVHPDMLPLVRAIDEIRLRRISAAKKDAESLDTDRDEALRLHQEEARYTVNAINNAVDEGARPLALPGYLDLLYRNRAYPPSRNQLLQLSVYMRCLLEETNTLLLAAGFKTLQLYLEGELLERALDAPRRLIATLPFPCFILARNWDIKGANAAFRRMYDVSLEAEEEIAHRGHLNLLRMVFDARYPYYWRLNPTGNDTWQPFRTHLAVNVRAFKSQNLHSWEERWFRDVHEPLERELPTFKQLWSEIQIDSPIIGHATDLAPRSVAGPPNRYAIHREVEAGAGPVAINVISIHISLGDSDYPLIIGSPPADDVAIRHFHALGLPVLGWDWRPPPSQ